MLVIGVVVRVPSIHVLKEAIVGTFLVLRQLQKDERALCYDRVNHNHREHHDEHRAVGEEELALVAANICACILDEEA